MVGNLLCPFRPSVNTVTYHVRPCQTNVHSIYMYGTLLISSPHLYGYARFLPPTQTLRLHKMSIPKTHIWWTHDTITSTGDTYPGLYWKGFSAVLRSNRDHGGPLILSNCEKCAVFRWKRRGRKSRLCSCVRLIITFFLPSLTLANVIYD